MQNLSLNEIVETRAIPRRGPTSRGKSARDITVTAQNSLQMNNNKMSDLENVGQSDDNNIVDSGIRRQILKYIRYYKFLYY